MILVNSVGALSNIWRDYHQSTQFDVHCRRLLDKFAPSTLFKYINTLQCIHSILLEFAWTWQDITRHYLSDLLQMAHEGKHTEWGFGATTAIKALRWAQKLLSISAWQMLYDPIANSFFNSSNHERRESVPLSLFLVSQWERRILMKEFSLQEQILLGEFLCLLWGGLRFADGQHVSLQSLSWCITALRGSCYRTKTSRSGQPWAIQARSFLSQGTWSWVAQLDILWSQAHNAISDADFWLPMTKDDIFAYPRVPMPCSQALHWLRNFCSLSWKHSVIPISANPGDSTMHSLKTTTLSTGSTRSPFRDSIATGLPENHSRTISVIGTGSKGVSRVQLAFSAIQWGHSQILFWKGCPFHRNPKWRTQRLFRTTIRPIPVPRHLHPRHPQFLTILPRRRLGI